MPDSGYLVNMDRQRAKFNDLLERTFSIHANQIAFKFLARRPEEGRGKERRAFWGTLAFRLKPKDKCPLPLAMLIFCHCHTNVLGRQ